MQSCEMPARAFALYEEKAREEKRAKIHHEHLGNGQVRVREVFTGTRDADLHSAMDERRALLESMGAGGFHRTRIGRNSACPCGSGRKFKKCCIDSATTV